MLTLADILVSEIECLDPEAELLSAFKMLTSHNCYCCVIAGDNKIPLGVITEQDLVQLISIKGNTAELMSEAVSMHMKTPASLPSDSDLEGALNWIEQRKLRYLLVSHDDASIAGIVTQAEMLRATMRIMRSNSADLESKVTRRTEQLEKVNKKLVTLSLVDPLTKLGNRRALEVDIMKVHASGIRHRRAYSVILFDLDYFKNYNDHYGHQSGDEALVLFSSHLRKSIREADMLFRYGGEEFLMIMPDTSAAEAILSVERIVDELSKLGIPHLKSPLGHLTTSAGVASSHHLGQRLASWRKVVELADDSLYEAKKMGRNQVASNKESALKAVN